MKKTHYLLFLSLVATTGYAIYLAGSKTNISKYIYSSQANGGYSFHLENSNKLVVEDDTYDILTGMIGQKTYKTASNNNLTFSFAGAFYSDNGFVQLDGYLENKTLINGLSAINITSSSEEDSFNLSYGYYAEDSTLERDLYYRHSAILDSSNNFTINFSNNINIFKIENSAKADILSITINYACNDTYYKDGVFTYSFDEENQTYTVDSVSSETQRAIIPETYNGYPVTKIKDGAFSNCLDIREVHLSKNVDLSETIIPQLFSASTIDKKTVERITIDEENNTAFVSNGIVYSKDGTKVMFCTASVEGVVDILDGVQDISFMSFCGCNKITHVNIPSSVINVLSSGYPSFAVNKSLISFSVDPDNKMYTSIDGVVYSKNLKTLVLFPGGRTGSYNVLDSVETIYAFAFYFSSLEKVTLPNTLYEIMIAAFSYSNIRTINVPDSVEVIGQSILNNCYNLESVVIGDGVSEVSGSLFGGTDPELMKNFKSISFGKNLRYYDSSELLDFPTLEEIIFQSPYMVDINLDNCSIYENGYYFTNDSNPYKYFVSVVDKTVSNIVFHPDCVEVLSGAFDDCSNLIEITFSEGIEIIGSLYAYEQLETVTLPSSFKETTGSLPALINLKYCGTISDWLINLIIYPDLTNVENIYICDNNNVLYLPTDICVPDAITNIPDYAFCGWKQISAFELNDNVTNIGNDAFANCSEEIFAEYKGSKYLGNSSNQYLYLITGGENNSIHENCVLIASNAFESSTITEIEISNVKYIGDRAFYYCCSLEHISELTNVVSIGSNAFVTPITNYTLGYSITSIGMSAFAFSQGFVPMYISIPSSCDMSSWHINWLTFRATVLYF